MSTRTFLFMIIYIFKSLNSKRYENNSSKPYRQQVENCKIVLIAIIRYLSYAKNYSKLLVFYFKNYNNDNNENKNNLSHREKKVKYFLC